MFDVTEVYKDFFIPLYDEVAELGNFDGKYYMVPWASGPSGLVYNTNYLKNENLPNTTDELIKLVDDIKSNKI